MFRSRVFAIISTIFIVIALFIGVYLVGVKTGFIKRAGGLPANLTIDVGTSFVNPADCWRNLAQGGEGKGRMLAPAIDLTRKLQPQYIRLDHIYDNYDVVSRDGSGQLNFNWGNLDASVNDILAMGAKPFFSLSYMPPVIAKDGRIDNTPVSWADWQLTVQRTIEHYSGRGGMNLSDVYYEVWNEPDLFGGFKTYGDKNYLDLYSYAVGGARSAQNVNPFKIGGPATSGLYRSWVDAILRLSADGNARVDFLSWHNYYSDADRYDNDVKNVLSWLSDYQNFKNIELIVSELGIDSLNNPAYDNNLGAMQTLASVSTLQANINKCFNFEVIDGAGPQQFWGRWGILTNEKFGAPQAKPRYYALQFLNRMTGSRMSVGGVGSWVKSFARYDGSKIRIMVVNYDPQGVHGEVVPINLTHMPFKNFTYSRINFGGGTTSRDISIDANSTSWSTTEGFSPNTAAVFEITPK